MIGELRRMSGPFLKLGAVAQGRFRPGEHKALPPSLASETRYEIRPGDLLVTRSNTPEKAGDACCVSETRHHLIMSDLIYRLRLDQRRCLHCFACYWLISCAGRAAIEADARRDQRFHGQGSPKPHSCLAYPHSSSGRAERDSAAH